MFFTEKTKINPENLGSSGSLELDIFVFYCVHMALGYLWIYKLFTSVLWILVDSKELTGKQGAYCRDYTAVADLFNLF